MRRRATRWAIVALVGAIVCTVGDHLHVVTGVLAYPHPDVWQQAWWVPLLFAGSAVAMVLAVPPVRRAFGEDGPRAPLGRSLAEGTIAFVTAYTFTAFGNGMPNVVLGVLLGFWIARVLGGVPMWLVVYALGAGIAGPATEATLSAIGLFAYRAPDVALVPRWLPALYLHAGLLAGPVRRWVER